MKHLKPSFVLLGGILLIFSGCQRIDEPQAPELIAPEEGAVFDTVPPTFIWSSQELVEGYVIQVYEPVPPPLIQDYLIREKLNDTTYAFPETLFRNTPIDTLHWLVGSKAFEGVYWSEVRSFVIDKPEPGDPTAHALISPADGSVLDTVPPTFTWSSDSLSYGYLFRIWTNSTTEVEDSLGDTTYAMSQEFFDGLVEGTYNWSAATVSASGKKFWSDAWSFIITRPEPVIDLDTTYFPFGLGYKWCYESNNGGVYDTFTVEVTDSSWIADTLVFQLIGSFYGISNPVEIWDNQVTVFDELIDVVPQACTLINEPLKFYVISYRSDILWITVYYPWGEDPDGFAECWTTHERVIGARKQERTNWSGGGPVSGFTYTLLTMTTPEGQRYP